MRKVMIVIVVLSLFAGVVFALREPIQCFFYLRSPHQQLIAFLREGDLYLTEIVGNKQCRVAEGSFGRVSWSPNGAQLTVQNLQQHDIYLVNSDGTNLRNVTQGSGDFWVVTAPSWSPDGSFFVYTGQHPTESWSDVFMFDLATLERRALTEGMAAGAPSFSPDGSHIAFTTGDNALYVMDTADGEQQLLRNDVEITKPPVWSPDGDQIALNNRDFDLIVVGLDGSILQTLVTTGLDNPGPEIWETYAWSPDGTQLAVGVAVFTPDLRQDLYLLDIATGEYRALVMSEADEYDPVWMQDGQSILFTREAEGCCDDEIVQLILETGETRILANGHDPVPQPNH